jgi:hypothetical protein
VRNFSAESIHFVLWSSVNILGTQRAHNFLYPNFSVRASWSVVLDSSGMMWCNFVSPTFGGTLDRCCHFNASHSNKAGSTTVKQARLTGKGSKSTAVLPQ